MDNSWLIYEAKHSVYFIRTDVYVGSQSENI